MDDKDFMSAPLIPSLRLPSPPDQRQPDAHVLLNQEPIVLPAASGQTTHSHQTDGSFTCAICLDSWTSDGPHRVVSLKCGHLFGQSCIEQSLSGGMINRCPTCRSFADIGDVRPIFLDTSAVSSLRNQLTRKIALCYCMSSEKEAVDRSVAELKQQLEQKDAEFQDKEKKMAHSLSELQRELEYMRSECQRLEQRLENEEQISVRVSMRGSDGATEVHKFQVQTKNKMDGLMTAVAQKVDMPAARLEFRLKGYRIREKETGDQIGLQHEDVIHVYVRTTD